MTDERPERDHRPSPDALLRHAGGGGRGRLKVFLGAAPGVGKTYEMLMQGRSRRLDGVDAVIGVVETHGRIETDLLTKSFETIPKKRLPYKGHVLAEMDLDAILQRRPKLVLVDELAHTNAEGSRHPKRHMDVAEILAAGIDVYTTLNVQHLESLNDVVARITGVRVRETVPDSILDGADDVELIDLTPEDLIQRLKDGKVYIPQQAERAIEGYFMPGNLTALRELALRRTAQRVDAQMVDYMRAHAIQGPWEAGERVLVCIGEGRGAAALVRHGRRLADRLRASWTAISIETSQTQRLSEKARDRVAEALRLAEQLGGQAVTVPAAGIAEGVLDYARANNVTHIVVSAERRARWRDILLASPAHELIRRAPDIAIHIVPDGAAQAPDSGMTAPAEEPRWLDPVVYGASALMVAAALGLSLVLQRMLGVTNVALLFLTAVLASSVLYGLWPALFAALVSVLAYNFFFLPPLYTFTIAAPENILALITYAVVAVIASNLTASVRAQAMAARQRAKMTEDLYLFSRKLAVVIQMDDLLWATAHQIAQMLKLRVVLLLPEGESVAVRAGFPPEDLLDDADLAAAKWSWQHAQAAGRGADTLPGAKRLFLPMKTGRGTVGVIGLDKDAPGPLLSPDQRRLLEALSDQAALAIERINLVADVDRTRLAAETERLRNALLTSISHDLRTPLASILGSATSLETYRGVLDDKAQNELIGTIRDEAERLNRFIGNLLDMTRLESGAVKPKHEPVDIGDVVGSVLHRAATILERHTVELDTAAGVPTASGDPVLVEQVLFNLLDNAAKYTPAGSTIRIAARADGGRIVIEISDDGPGLPHGAQERIFDKFYRAQAGDGQRAGTGLGLAIARGFVEAMGGTMTAGNRDDRGGAVFTIVLPAYEQPAPEIAA